MSVATFYIMEDRKDGKLGESFEWTSDSRPANAARGGARACPRQPWTFGGNLRTVRTDYPGARTPSEQVLGPAHAPFTLEGRFDDRYNFAGYAEREQRRFEEMCRRGNTVQIQFQNQSFVCLITNWSFPYKRAWEIGYSFTVSVHDRPDGVTLADRAPETVQSPTQAFDALDVAAQAMATQQNKVPAAALTTGVNTGIGAKLSALLDDVAAIGKTLDNAQKATSGAAASFKRTATQFRAAAGSAFNVVDTLVTIRSDIEMGVQQATSVLSFEDWSRSLRFHGRLVMGQSSKAARDMDSRSESKAIAMYRPQKGESLYDISRRFYGTPHSWRLIADRNHLNVINLTGNEYLIIPERGEA